MGDLVLRDCPSPNQGPRRDGLTPTLVVIHYTAMESADAAVARLCDPVAEVSAHYLIGAGGEIIRMVPEDQRAWHAGAGTWRGQDDINSRSIGIELDNRGDHPFSAPQMDALEALLRGIMDRWKIPAAGVIGHSDMAPGRKSDPGRHFDWARLARQRLAAQPCRITPPEMSEQAFLHAAEDVGYPSDLPFEAVLSATRLRHAPWRRGPLAQADFDLIPRT